MSLPDGFRIVRRDVSFAPQLANLFEHYLHDMAEWFQFDTGPDGAYRYPVHGCWQDDGVVYVPYAGNIPIGFAAVAWLAAEDQAECRDMKEFFVVRRHRHGGVADALAGHVWDRHPGPWVVRVYRGNRPALPFWRRAVAAHSSGAFSETEQQSNDKSWSYFSFVSDPVNRETTPSS
ncbi:MAG: hypothetical protein RIC56_07470 [Pseudomonadales bacterium]